MGNCHPVQEFFCPAPSRSTLQRISISKLEEQQQSMVPPQIQLQKPNHEQSIGKSANHGLAMQKEDFEKIKELGCGACGKVILVRMKRNNKIYAMKIMNKDKVLKNISLSTSTVLEKNVLLNKKCKFCIDLKYSFQTERKLYIIMEYCAGGSLFRLLKSQGRFNKLTSKFVFAQVVLGMQFLHEEKKVMYRDLKPENILVTENGYIKLADFGLAKKFEEPQERTKSFVGTPDYIAPEIIESKFYQQGYTKNVDIWTLGVFLYELLSGETPFQNHKHDWSFMSIKIIENNPSFPGHFSPESVNIIKNLLQSNPLNRLGAVDFDEIKSHSYWSEAPQITWEAIDKMEYDSPLLKIMGKVQDDIKKRPEPIIESITAQGGPLVPGWSYYLPCDASILPGNRNESKSTSEVN